MQHVIKHASVMLGKMIYSQVIYTGKTKRTSVQMTTTVPDGAASDARAYIQVSNDRVNWFNLGILETTGTGIQKDGGPYEALWEYTRIMVERTPDNGFVDVYMATRESK